MRGDAPTTGLQCAGTADAIQASRDIEAKLRRLTETDAEYVEFIEKLAQAKGDSERLRIRYESYKNLFEARRSLLSYQKAEMKLL